MNSDSINRLVTKFSSEVPATAVGFTAVAVYIASNQQILDWGFVLEISSFERTLMITILSYIVGKVFTYVGVAPVMLISYLVHIKSFKQFISNFAEKFEIMRPGTKSVGLFPDKRITLPAVFKWIGEHENVQKVYLERVASLSFTNSLLGALLVLPYITDTSFYFRFEYIIATGFAFFLALNSKLSRNEFYGHCAKEVSNERRQMTLDET